MNKLTYAPEKCKPGPSRIILMTMIMEWVVCPQGMAKSSAPSAAQMAALSRKAAEAQLQLNDARRDAAEVTRCLLFCEQQSTCSTLWAVVYAPATGRLSDTNFEWDPLPYYCDFLREFMPACTARCTIKKMAEAERKAQALSEENANLVLELNMRPSVKQVISLQRQVAALQRQLARSQARSLEHEAAYPETEGTPLGEALHPCTFP